MSSAIVTDNPEGNGAEEFCNVASDKKIVAFICVGAFLLACTIASALFLAQIL